MIERIPVRFVVVILVLPSEGSSRRALDPSPPSRASRPGRGRRSRVVGAVTVCLFGGRKENTRGISIPPHSIESNPLRIRGTGGMDGSRGRAGPQVAAKMMKGAEVVPL